MKHKKSHSKKHHLSKNDEHEGGMHSHMNPMHHYMEKKKAKAHSKKRSHRGE